MRDALTSQERAANIYLKPTGPPTVPQHVTPETSLESLNLNWREKDLPEKERTKHVHRLHPYLGKFIPQIVEIFLRKYFHRGNTILDPFCGSGTTLVQANELGMNAIGYDISAFNVLLCRAKTTEYDLAKLKKEAFDVLDKVRLATQASESQPELWETAGIRTAMQGQASDYLRAWFAPRALHELLTYRQLIESEGYAYRDLLMVILSRSARSARLTTHFDLDFPNHPQREPYWCHKHGRTCQPTEEAWKFLRRYTLDTIRRVEEFSALGTRASVTVEQADSRTVDYPAIDGVITSPPYVGLIDYHEQHVYAYHLLGLSDRRRHEIGAANDGSGEKARQRYQQDIAGVFGRVVAAMPAGGRAIVIANDKANLYGRIAKMVGVRVEAIIYRHVNRRTGRRANEFYESVLVWQKE